ncbi:hypothetical protein RRG08_043919 [Elysia crispata]|uniref:Uncharacterized protein n=1 Tax=Elysia crispata TaxID=231223 RepID=A0AAE0YB24_9GAST|nr:hypothetical protein RRG08_043919 [Elysia crispata]
MRHLHPVVRASRLVCLFVVIFTPLVTTARSDDRTKENVRFQVLITRNFLLYALPQCLMAIHNLYKKNSLELESTLEFLVTRKLFVQRMALYNSAFQKKIEEEKIAKSEKSMEEIESEILVDHYDRILRKMIERGTRRRLGFGKMNRHQIFLAMRDLYEGKSKRLIEELWILEELEMFRQIMVSQAVKLLEKMIKEM